MKRGPRVLAIDDEPAMTSWIKTLLEQNGYEVSTAEVGALGQERLKAWRPAAIVTDLILPDIDGVEHIRKLKELDPDVAVIVLSGQGDVPRSVEAVKAGAFDFLEKPVDPDLLLDRLAKAISETRLVDENTRLKKRLDERGAFQHIVGTSDRMRALFEMIACVAPSEANILIRGENGTGKELIANAIHENSQRSKGRFVKVNCAAIPQELIESELFGTRRAPSRVRMRTSRACSNWLRAGLSSLTRLARCRLTCRPSCFVRFRSANTGRSAASGRSLWMSA